MREKDRTAPTGVQPVDIKVRRGEQRLLIEWQDGLSSELSFVALRKGCPCASCKSERDKREASAVLLPVLAKDPGTGAPQITGANLVGHYALQIQWSDGHNTGIYDFRYLRSLGDEN